MNDSEFEIDLRSLRPRALSDDLQKRVADDLRNLPPTNERASTAPASWRWVGPALLAAAACLVFVLTLTSALRKPSPAGSVAQHAPAPAANDDFEPRSAGQTLVSMNDHGVYVRDDRSAVRMVQYHFVDSIELRNRAGATLNVQVPRHEFVALPVNFQ